MDKKECIYPHNGEQQTEQQSKQWTKCADSSPKKSKTILSAGKIITFIFRNSPWIVFINYIKIAGWINIFNRVLKLLKIQTSILTVLGRNNNKWPFWAKQKIVFFRKCSIDSHIYNFFFSKLSRILWGELHTPVEADGFRVRVATPILAHLRHVILELRRTLGQVAGTGLEISLLAVDVVVPPAVETARSRFFALWRSVAVTAVDRRFGLRNLFIHFLVLGGAGFFR